jgi:hypothetical protein
MREVQEVYLDPPEGIKVITSEESLAEIFALVMGPGMNS